MDAPIVSQLGDDRLQRLTVLDAVANNTQAERGYLRPIDQRKTVAPSDLVIDAVRLG
jgi:hypothetical protein